MHIELNQKRKVPGFTLVEMLVVIGIIVILAGLTVGVMGLMGAKTRLAAANASRNQIVAALEDYKGDHSQYPPDNANSDWFAPPLFYELGGTFLNSAPAFETKIVGGHALTSAQANSAFGLPGFINVSSEGPTKVNLHVKGLKEKLYGEALVNNTAVNLLVLPAEWTPRTMGANPLGATTLNPWHYRSNNPTNNVESFDLWGFLPAKEGTERIDNWTRSTK